MRYSELFERYTANNSYFKQYMKAGNELDPYATWYYVCEWLFQNYESEEIQEWLGVEATDSDELHEEDPDLFYKLPENIQKEMKEDIIDRIMRDDPVHAPTTAHMSFDKQLKRNTWLVHFSDNASQIWQEGFKVGVDQMDKLGLTTYMGQQSKETGGYNFAFEANSRYASNAARQGKYGRHAVIFQSAGIRCEHYGDEEDQVVFWGEDVDWHDIIYIRNDGGDWCLISRRDLKNGNDVLLRSENFESIVKWVANNHQQYRKYLYGK